MVSFESMFWPGKFSSAHLGAIAFHGCFDYLGEVGEFFTKSGVESRRESKQIMAHQNLPVTMGARANPYGWYF